jgi:tetratricopeptide (TPR) repeat protein
VSAKGGFDLEMRRLRAASGVRPEYFDDFSRLVKSLRASMGFQLLVIEFNDEVDRSHLIGKLDELLAAESRQSAVIDIGYPAGRRIERFADIEEQMRTLAVGRALIHLIGGEVWFDKARWQAFNLRREVVSSQVTACLTIWLTPSAVSDMAVSAPDLWAWRGGVYSFLHAARAVPLGPKEPLEEAKIDRATRARRIGEIRADLAEEATLDDGLRFRLLAELSEHLESTGEGEEAMLAALELRRIAERLGDDRLLAQAIVRIADLLHSSGRLEEALRIRQEELLPLYEGLGDLFWVAMAKRDIAWIHRARGQVEEALRLCREEVLPAYEELGHAFGAACTKDDIADILEADGQRDEALRLRREQVLPAYEAVGNARFVARAKQKIARNLRVDGQLGEALRILQDEVLLVNERVGDLYWIASTKRDIAALLLARGERDEPLRILEEEVLPVHERLGDRFWVAYTKSQIAHVLQLRGQLDDALRVYEGEVLSGLRALDPPEETAWVEARIDQLRVLGARSRPLSSLPRK